MAAIDVTMKLGVKSPEEYRETIFRHYQKLLWQTELFMLIQFLVLGWVSQTNSRKTP